MYCLENIYDANLVSIIICTCFSSIFFTKRKEACPYQVKHKYTYIKKTFNDVCFNINYYIFFLW